MTSVTRPRSRAGQPALDVHGRVWSCCKSPSTVEEVRRREFPASWQTRTATLQGGRFCFWRARPSEVVGLLPIDGKKLPGVGTVAAPFGRNRTPVRHRDTGTAFALGRSATGSPSLWCPSKLPRNWPADSRRSSSAGRRPCLPSSSSRSAMTSPDSARSMKRRSS